MRANKLIVKIFLGTAIFLMLIILIKAEWRTYQQIKVKDLNGVTFVSPAKYEDSFSKSSATAKKFFDLYRQALENMKNGQHQTAIKLFNESLVYAAIGPSKAMVYSQLADIYKELNDKETELKYVELVPRFSANPKRQEEFRQRAVEIRKILEGRGTNAALVS